VGVFPVFFFFSLLQQCIRPPRVRRVGSPLPLHVWCQGRWWNFAVTRHHAVRSHVTRRTQALCASLSCKYWLARYGGQCIIEI
jgi:hypothetical protein